MENILSVLPLLEGWEYSSAVKKKETVKKKQSLVDIAGKGYLVWALARVDDPRAELTFKSDEKILTNSLKSAIDIFGSGLTMPNPLGIWCSLFDPSNDDYTIVFAPPSLLPFTKSLTVDLEATAEKQELKLHRFEHSVIRIVDEAKFKSSLKALSSAEAEKPK